jgi:hypothetical protein
MRFGQRLEHRDGLDGQGRCDPLMGLAIVAGLPLEDGADDHAHGCAGRIAVQPPRAAGLKMEDLADARTDHVREDHEACRVEHVDPPHEFGHRRHWPLDARCAVVSAAQRSRCPSDRGGGVERSGGADHHAPIGLSGLQDVRRVVRHDLDGGLKQHHCDAVRRVRPRPAQSFPGAGGFAMIASRERVEREAVAEFGMTAKEVVEQGKVPLHR